MKKSEPPKEAGRDIERRSVSTQVDVLAKQAGALVKPKPPKFRDFNRFVDDVDRLVAFRDELNEMASGDIRDSAEWCQKLVAKCKAGLERFNRRENFDDPDDKESELSQAYIAKRVTVMVASFPNANPSSPEGYMQMLIEHISAIEGLTEVELEGACREIVETQKFAPAISEVMEVVRKHREEWFGRYYAIRRVEEKRCEALTRALKREAEEDKKAHEQAIDKARWEIAAVTRQIKSLAKDIDDAKAAIEQANTWLSDVIKRHAEAEKRESEANGRLQALLALQASSDEQEQGGS